MLFPPLLVPPTEGRFDTWYRVSAFAASGLCASAGARTAPQQTAASTMKRILVVNCFVKLMGPPFGAKLRPRESEMQCSRYHCSVPVLVLLSYGETSIVFALGEEL